MAHITPPRIRPETPADVPAIHNLVKDAFADEVHSDGTEHNIVDKLRERGKLYVSLVAVDEVASGGEVIGHVAASPVTVTRSDSRTARVDGWFGIAPLSVTASARRRGIGALLMESVLEELRSSGAKVAVLLGDPDYYERFGFDFLPRVAMAGVPDDAATYFQVMSFDDDPLPGAGSPILTVTFDEAFGG